MKFSIAPVGLIEPLHAWLDTERENSADTMKSTLPRELPIRTEDNKLYAWKWFLHLWNFTSNHKQLKFRVLVCAEIIYIITTTLGRRVHHLPILCSSTYILHDVCLDKKIINKKTCLHQARLCSYSILFVGASYANNKIQIRVSIMWQSYVHQNLSAYPEIAFNSVCFPP